MSQVPVARVERPCVWTTPLPQYPKPQPPGDIDGDPPRAQEKRHLRHTRHLLDAEVWRHAIEGENLITLSTRGYLSFNANKVSFTADPDGNYRYQIAGDEGWASHLLNLIRASNR